MTPDIDLDALTALERDATPAPWEATALLTLDEFVVTGGPEAYAVGRPWTAADAVLIAAMRNTWPVLLSALTATRAELDEAWRTMEQFRVVLERERDAARAEADKLRADLETSNAVALSNKRAHTVAFEECERLTAERAALLAWAAAELGTSLIHKRIREQLGEDASVQAMAAPAAAPKPTPSVCPDQYTRPGGRQRGDRIVRCHLPSGHIGEHEEAETECTWLNAADAGAGDGEQDADRLTAALDGSMVSPKVRQAITSLMGNDVQVSVPLRQKLLTAAERALKDRREASRAKGDGEQDTATTERAA